MKGQPKLVPSCYTPVADKMEVHHRLAATCWTCARADARVHAAQPPGRLPDLRQGGRVHAAEALLRLGRASSRATTASRSSKHKVVDLGPHIVLDQERCILCTRCIRVCDEVAGTHRARRWPSRGDHEVLTTAPGHAARQPLLAQHRRRLPGRRADRQGLPLRDAGLGALRRPRRSARAAPPAATSRSTPRATRSTAWSRARTQTVNKYWMCDEGRFTYKRVHADRLAAPLVAGLPVDWDRALDEAAKLLRTRARREPGQRRGGVQRPVDQRGSATRWRGWPSSTCR